MVDLALKAISVTTLNESILVPSQYSRFVRAMQHKATILNEARFIPMESHTAKIDRVGFVGRIMRSGGAVTTGVQAHRVLADGEHAAPTFSTNTLIARELQAICGIQDTALRRNLERAGFENTLVDLFGEAAGRDMEEFAILADSAILHADDDILSLTDGWAKLGANKIYGGAGGQFDPDDDGYPENLFQALLDALPKQYLQNKADWRIYVDFDTEDEYRNTLKARGTALGDTAQTTSGVLMWKGIQIKYCPLMERAAAVGDYANAPGRIAMLQHPDNMVWGIFHQITIEPDRVPKERKTDFVLTVEGDAHYEDENACVIAYLDKNNP